MRASGDSAGQLVIADVSIVTRSTRGALVESRGLKLKGAEGDSPALPPRRQLVATRVDAAPLFVPQPMDRQPPSRASQRWTVRTPRPRYAADLLPGIEALLDRLASAPFSPGAWVSSTMKGKHNTPKTRHAPLAVSCA